MTDAPQTPIRIDLADYVYAGEGANGASYFHRSDPSILLKIYTRGTADQPIRELETARKVYEAGIPTPEPGDLVVTDDDLIGIRFRRILGKRSYARAIGDSPGEVGAYAVRFARLVRQLHDTHVDTAVFDNVKDRYLALLKDNPFFTADQKERMGAFIRAVPDTDTALHGDLQFGNVIFDDRRDYFIDLGDFCYGHPMFDLGMVYITGKLNDADFTRTAYHMEPETASAFWDAFAPAYFGPGADLEAIEREVRIFAGLKTLIVERDTKRPMPEFRAMLEGTIY